MYTPWSVTPGETPTAAKWNILGANDASFNDGTGFGDETVLSRHLAPTIFEETCSTNTTINSTSETDITGMSKTFTPDIASYARVTISLNLAGATSSGDTFEGYLDVDGSNFGDKMIYSVSTGGLNISISKTWLVPVTAASHVFKAQFKRASGGGGVDVTTDSNMIIELVGNNNVAVS